MPAIMNKIFVAQLLLFLVVGIEAIPLAAKPHPVFLSKGVSSSDISWEDCTTSGIGKIIDIEVKPDPPAKGSDLEVEVFYSLNEKVTSGEVSLSLKYSFIPIDTKKYDLCDLVEKGGMDCPLNPTERTALTVTEKIPGTMLPGQYSGKVTATDQDGREIVCLDLKFKL